jgi:TetR/AcrR family transcriptional regulator
MIVNNSPPAPHPTRARILAAATELFAELGYDGAGVDKIARRAGVNKAMLYYHVGDKQELFGAVVRQFITAIQSAVRDSLVDTTEPLDRLRAIPTALATVAAERPHWRSDHQRMRTPGSGIRSAPRRRPNPYSSPPDR